MSDTLKPKIKAYLLREFLPGENADELTDTTPLISGGILDSIATLKFVMFLEEEYKVTFAPHEVDREYLDTLDGIVNLLASKNAKASE